MYCSSFYYYNLMCLCLFVSGSCPGHEVAIPIEPLVQSLDTREETLSTLLCYLQLAGWLEVLSPLNDSCIIKCYGGAGQLRALSRKLPPVSIAMAQQREKGWCVVIVFVTLVLYTLFSIFLL